MQCAIFGVHRFRFVGLRKEMRDSYCNSWKLFPHSHLFFEVSSHQYNWLLSKWLEMTGRFNTETFLVDIVFKTVAHCQLK